MLLEITQNLLGLRKLRAPDRAVEAILALVLVHLSDHARR
jgi:hypothetical protein